MNSEEKITVEGVINLGIEKGVYIDPDMLITREEVLSWHNILTKGESGTINP